MSDITAHGGFGPFDPYWTDAVLRRGRLRGSVGRRVALGFVAGTALVGVAAFGPAPGSAPDPASVPAATLASGEIVDPTLAPLFTFEIGESARAHYEARIDRATGARRDAYSLGALEGDAPAVRVEMWRDAKPRVAQSLFVEIAEASAAFGAAVERLGASQMLTSSQGPVEWASLTLADGRAQRGCVGFRLAARADGGLHGVACAGAGAKIDARELSCLLDRLALTRAGREAGLSDIVKGFAVRRPTCRAAIG